VTPALGTPSALVGTNITGTAAGLTAGNVTTNANLTGAVTSVGNATSLGSFTSAQLATALTDETGSGANVFATSPTLVTPILGTPTSATLTNATGLPLSTGVTGTLPVANGGTGTATPSIIAGTNVTVTGTWPNQTIAASGGGGSPGGSTTQVQYNNAGAFGGITGATTNGTALTLVAPVLGTPASATLTNATGLPLSTGVTGTLPVANGGTGLTTTPANGALDIGNGTGFTRTTLTAGSNITITNSSGGISIAAAGGSSQWTTSGTQIYYNTGNVGIGTTSPDTYTDGAKNLTLLSSSAGRANLALVGTQSSADEILARLNFTNTNTSNASYRLCMIDAKRGSDNNSGYFDFSTSNAGTTAVRATITSDGNLLLGSTTNSSNSKLRVNASGQNNVETERETTGAAGHFSFVNPNGSVGTIQTSGSSTLYNTSSDYRLKNTIAPMTGALAKVALLKPCTYKWNVDGSDGQGFIAHELAEVMPQCVSGEKDAVRTEKYEISPFVPATYDEKGNQLTSSIQAVIGEREVPAHQGIDTSFLVATLTAAIQEQQTMVESLKARLDAANL